MVNVKKDKPIAVLFGIIESHRSRVGDGSLVLQISLNEMEAEQQVLLLGMVRLPVYMVVCEAQLDSGDLLKALETAPEPPVVVKSSKKQSLSHQLRNKLFALHGAQGGDKEDFEAYYEKIMHGLLDFYQTKIDGVK